MLPPDKDGDAKVTIARGGCQLHPTLSKGEKPKDELCKFVVADDGMVVCVPVGPFAFNSEAVPGYPDLFYIWMSRAHVGERNRISERYYSEYKEKDYRKAKNLLDSIFPSTPTGSVVTINDGHGTRIGLITP